MDDAPGSSVHRVVRSAVVLGVLAAVAAFVVGVIVREERWTAEPILGVVANDGADGRTLHVLVESCGQDDRVDVVGEDEEAIVLRAESRGTPGGDCADGVATACTIEPIGSRQVVDDATGASVDVEVGHRRELPSCG